MKTTRNITEFMSKEFKYDPHIGSLTVLEDTHGNRFVAVSFIDQPVDIEQIWDGETVADCLNRFNDADVKKFIAAEWLPHQEEWI